MNTDRKPWLYVICDAIIQILAACSLGTMLFASLLSFFIGPLLWGILAIAAFVYVFYTFWMLTQDMNTICQEVEEDSTQTSPNWLIVFLLSLVTCSIYQYFWVYKQGNRLKAAAQKYHVDDVQEDGTSLLVFWLLGMITCGITKIYATYRWLVNMDKMAEAYNAYKGDGVPVQPVQSIGSNVESGNTIVSDMEGVKAVPSNPSLVKIGKLVGLKGIYKDIEFPIENGEELLVGRDSSKVHIIISDERVSRKHCGVCYDSEKNIYYVRDYSSNGTLGEDGKAFAHDVWTVCKPGTMISIGKSGNSFILL